MQTVSNWTSKVGLVVVPEREFEVSAFCFSKSRVRRFNGAKHECGSRNFSLVLDSRHSRCDMSHKIGWRCEFMCICPKLMFVPVSEPIRCTLGAAFELSGDLKKQKIGNGNTKKDKNAANDLAPDQFNLPEGEIGEEKNSRVDVRALAYSLRSAKTAEDVEDILKEKGELPLQVYCSMIRGFGKDKRFECAMALVEWLKRKKDETGGAIGPNVFIYNSLLGAMKQSEQYGEMEKILSDMNLQGIIPNLVTYNTLMVIYMEKGDFSKALGILDEIEENGFGPSPVSYSTALLVYRRMEDGSIEQIRKYSSNACYI